MITINGNKIVDADNLKLSDFLKREGYNFSMIAVECNGSIVPKTSYEEKLLEDGD
ncbi:MAG: sulfur carrier protein ThiS, partial [Clostridium butyricum]